MGCWIVNLDAETSQPGLDVGVGIAACPSEPFSFGLEAMSSRYTYFSVPNTWDGRFWSQQSIGILPRRWLISWLLMNVLNADVFASTDHPFDLFAINRPALPNPCWAQGPAALQDVPFSALRSETYRPLVRILLTGKVQFTKID